MSLTPYQRKQVLRLAAACPKASRASIPMDSEAPDKLLLAIDAIAEARANNAVHNFALDLRARSRLRLMWRACMRAWDRFVNGPKAGTRAP